MKVDLNVTDIDWTQNCITRGIHNGRPEPIWNLPLTTVRVAYPSDELKELILDRIYQDAMQYVDNSPFQQEGVDEVVRYEQSWAQELRDKAKEIYQVWLERKLGELLHFYTSPTWRETIHGTVQLAKEGKLNKHFFPLHSHDSINLFCRILAIQAVLEISKSRTR
jgi:hypothetical protein